MADIQVSDYLLEFEEEGIYKGWIPSITGRLSFSVIGKTSFPSKTNLANIADKDKRFLICYQKRSGLDTLLPFKSFLSKAFLGINGTHVSLCIANSENRFSAKDDSLRGTLFIFRVDQDNQWNSCKGDVETKIEELQDFGLDYQTEISLTKNFEENIDDLITDLKKSCSFYSEFELKRTGDVTLKIPSKLCLTGTAPNFPTVDQKEKTTKEKEAFRDWICNQLFFFP